MLETFYNRLRDLCGDYGKGNGPSCTEIAKIKAQYARSLAGEFGILKKEQTFLGHISRRPAFQVLVFASRPCC
ncbi:MAG: hypothetical protein WCO60_15405 [Verrucomicrobiota bacterium]